MVMCFIDVSFCYMFLCYRFVIIYNIIYIYVCDSVHSILYKLFPRCLTSCCFGNRRAPKLSGRIVKHNEFRSAATHS